MSGYGWQESIGKLNERITLKSASFSVSANGEPVVSYTTVKTVWCNHRDLRGREILAQNKETAQADSIFIIRFKECQPQADWVVEFRGNLYQMIAPPVELGNRDGWELVCCRKREVL